MKTKTLRLSFPHANPNERMGNHLYCVEQVTESVEFVPYQYLTKTEVEVLCDSKAWRVTIVPMK